MAQAASRRRWRRPGRPTTTRCTAGVERLAPRLLRAGRDHVRDQERLRPDRRRRGPQPADRRDGHRRDHVPRRARGARGVPRRPRRLHRPGRRGHARRLRARRPLGGRVLRSRRLRRRRSPPHPHRRDGGRSGAATARRSAGPQRRHPTRRRARGGVGRPLHLRHRRRRRGARRLARRSPPCCPARSSPPARSGRTRSDFSTPASPSRWPPTATRAARSPRACRSASRSRCGT